MRDDYDGPERRSGYPLRRDSLAERWLTPAAATIVIGGIVWGVQLNVAVKVLTEQVASVTVLTEREERRVDKLSENMLKATMILEQIENRMVRLEEERDGKQ